MVLVSIMLDLHLPEMRQLFKDACCFQHSEFIVVQAPSNRGMVVRDKEEDPLANAEDHTNTSVTHSSAVY